MTLVPKLDTWGLIRWHLHDFYNTKYSIKSIFYYKSSNRLHVATWFPLGQQWTHLLPAWWATCLGCYLPGELPAWVLPACCTTCLPNQTRSNKTVLTQKPDLQSTRNRKTPNFIFLIFFWFFFFFLVKIYKNIGF